MAEIKVLADACSDIVDCAHKPAPVDPTGAYFAVGTPAMRGHRIDYSEARRISKETFDEWTTRLEPRAGDLLLAREAPVGPVVAIPENENVAPGQRTVLLRPRAGSVDSCFLYYYLTSPAMQAELQVKASGSTVPHLNVADVRALPTPNIPSLKEQQTIGVLLGALDDKIAANERLADLAGRLASALFESSTSRMSIQVRLSDVAEHRAGKYLAKEKYATGGQYFVYGSNSVMGKHHESLFAGAFTVLAKIGSYCGNLRWSQRPAWVNNNASALVPRAGVDPWVLRHALTRIEMSPHKVGSGQPYIRTDSLMASEVQWPSEHQVEAIGSLLRDLAERETLAAEESEVLAGTRDELLPLLMAGKIRVRDAEKAIEGVA